MLCSKEFTFQLVLGKNVFRQQKSKSQSQRPKGPSRHSSATDANANVCNGMGVHGMTGICAMLSLTLRHILGLYRDTYCYQDDILPRKSIIIRSRQCHVSCGAGVLLQCGFVDTCGCE